MINYFRSHHLRISRYGITHSFGWLNDDGVVGQYNWSVRTVERFDIVRQWQREERFGTGRWSNWNECRSTEHSLEDKYSGVGRGVYVDVVHSRAGPADHLQTVLGSGLDHGPGHFGLGTNHQPVVPAGLGDSVERVPYDVRGPNKKNHVRQPRGRARRYVPWVRRRERRRSVCTWTAPGCRSFRAVRRTTGRTRRWWVLFRRTHVAWTCWRTGGRYESDARPSGRRQTTERPNRFSSGSKTHRLRWAPRALYACARRVTHTICTVHTIGQR